MTLDELKVLVKEWDINSKPQWYDYWKVNERPSNIPSDPSAIYKRQSVWVSWSDLFGNENVTYWNFKTAIKFVRKLKLKTNGEYRDYCKGNDRPKELHSSPDNYYGKTNEWINWPHFLGTDTTPKTFKGRKKK